MMIPEKNSEDKDQDEILHAVTKCEKKLKSGGLGEVLKLCKLEQALRELQVKMTYYPISIE